MKMNFKQWGVTMLAASIAFTSSLSLPSNYVKAEEGMNSQLTAPIIKTFSASIMQKPSKGSELKEEKFEKEQVNLYDIKINPEEIVLSGDVSIDGEKTPFSLKGKLYKHQISGVLVGDLSDELGNFKVERFEIENSKIKAGVFFNRTLPDEAFALYMTHEGTNKFVIIEESALEITNSENLGNIYNGELQVASNELISWFTTFDPEETKIEQSGEESVQERATHQVKTSTWSLVNTYSIGFYIIYTDISAVKLFVYFPIDTNSSLNTEFKIIGTKMKWDNGLRDGTWYNSNWEIGSGPNGGVLEMRVNANKPQAIKQTGISYKMIKKGTPQFSIGWSYSWYGISAGVTFNGNQPVSSETFKNHNAAGVSKVEKVKNAFMLSAGDYLAGTWDLDYYPHLGENKAVNATVTLKFSAYARSANKKVYGPIVAYSTSPTKIISK